jgi:hypothetical protein
VAGQRSYTGCLHTGGASAYDDNFFRLISLANQLLGKRLFQTCRRIDCAPDSHGHRQQPADTSLVARDAGANLVDMSCGRFFDKHRVGDMCALNRDEIRMPVP